MDIVPIDRLRLPNDETELPRLRDEPFLVSEYAAAMRLYGGWGDFPPAVVDQDMLILSGVNRYLAAIDAGVTEVPAEIRECTTPGERLLIAAAENATHGKRWDSAAVTKIALLGDRFGVPARELAVALRVRVEKIERVPVTSVMRRNGKQEREEKVYSKKAVRPFLHGRVLSEAEEGVMAKLTTPHLAPILLEDLLRLKQLDALPQLNLSTYRVVQEAQIVLATWIERDQHLLDAS